MKTFLIGLLIALVLSCGHTNLFFPANLHAGSGTFYPAVSSDNGCWSSTLSDFEPGYILIGPDGGNYNAFFRFTNVTIPEGATINTCLLKVTNIGLSYNICNVNIYFNDVDAAVAPTNTAEGDALDLTEAVAWNAIPQWTLYTKYDSPELKTILQSIVDRDGFISGNAIQVIIKDNGSTPAAFRLVASTVNYPEYKAELYVEWSGGAPPPPPLPAATQDFKGTLNHMFTSVESFRAINGGTVDATAAFTDAFASLGSAGGTVYAPGKYLINKNLTIPDNVTLKCGYIFVGTYDAERFTNMNAIIVNPSKTIRISNGAGVDGCLIYRKGMTFPTTDSSAFAGTALTAIGHDAFVFNSMILGFDKAFYSNGNQRQHINNLQGDNQNGIDIRATYDIMRTENVHFWPFSIYPHDGNYKRTGTAYSYTNANDWGKATNNFSWGYKYGLVIDSCDSMTITSGGYDAPPGEISGGIGIWVKGTSSETRLLAPQTAGQDYAGILIDTSAGTLTHITDLNDWSLDTYKTDHGILINSGDVTIIGGKIRNADNGISWDNTTSKILIDGLTNLATTPWNAMQVNPYVIKGFINVGDGWSFPDLVAQCVAGSNTYVQYNDGGIMGADSNLKWNKSTQLLEASNITAHGMSITGTVASPGNLLYLNGYSGFTGYLIKAELNTVDRFSVDYNGLLETPGISTHGMSITGTVASPGNLLFLNGYPSFTGDLIHVEQNSVAVFTVDYTGSVYIRVDATNKLITSSATADSCGTGYRCLKVPN